MKNPQYKIHKFTDEEQKPKLSIRMQLKRNYDLQESEDIKMHNNGVFGYNSKEKKNI